MLVFTIKIFLFNSVDSVEYLVDSVKHSRLGSRNTVIVLNVRLSQPHVDEDVGEGEEAEDEDQGLQQVVGVENVDDSER